MRTKLTTLLMLASAGITLAGCTVGPDFMRPEAPEGDRYTAQSLKPEPHTVTRQQIVLGEQLDQAWWKLFRSTLLDDVVKRALAQNPTIVAAGFTLAQAQELTRARAGTLYPQLGLTAGVGREKYGDEFLGDSAKPDSFTYFSIGPVISYTFDYTGGGARAVEQQAALADIRREQLHAAYLAVTGNAVLLSLRIALTSAQIETVQALIVQDEKKQTLVRESFNAGSLSQLDIMRAQRQLAADRALLPPLKQEASVAQDALSVVLGQTPTQAVLPAFKLAQLTLPMRLPVSLPSELAHRRPDILAAEAELHAATASLGVATSNLYPQITINAAFSQQSTSINQLFASNLNGWSLIGGVFAPIFDGGTLRANQRAAKDIMQASAARYQQTMLTAFGQVADALQALEHGAQTMEAQDVLHQTADEDIDLTLKSQQAGQAGTLEVLESERRYLLATLPYEQARAQRLMDTAQLFLALGGSVPE